MDAMELLDRCRAAEGDIACLQGRLDRLRAAATRTTGYLGREGGKSSAESDAMASYAARMDEIERDIRLRRSQQAMDRIASAMIIDMVLGEVDRERDVVYAYYIDGLTYGGISARLGLSVSRVRTVKGEAVAKLCNVGGDLVARLMPAGHGRGAEQDDG